MEFGHERDGSRTLIQVANMKSTIAELNKQRWYSHVGTRTRTCFRCSMIGRDMFLVQMAIWMHVLLNMNRMWRIVRPSYFDSWHRDLDASVLMKLIPN